MVLGPGRLLDVPVADVAARFGEIRLIDADPSARSAWRNLRQRLSPDQKLLEAIDDVSGTMAKWTAAVTSFVKGRSAPDPSGLANLLESLQPAEKKLPNAEVVVSLNLLSQIGVYWRDRVENLLLESWRTETNEQGEFAPQLEKAVRTSIRNLEQQHLEQLASCASKLVVLLTDSTYLFYTKDRAEWQEEPALKVEEISIPGFECCETDTWLWHIAPQDIEQPDYGAIHQVRAFCFRK